jgi:hypothetical protein
LTETGNFVLYKHCKYRYIPGDFPAVDKFTCGCVIGGIIQVLNAGRENAKIFSGSQGVLGLFGPGVKRRAWDGDHSPLLNAEVTNEWFYTATSSYILS